MVSCCFQVNCSSLLSQLTICSFKCFRKSKIPFIVILGNMKFFLSFQTEIASSAFKTQITVKKIEVSGKGSLKIARPAFLNPLVFKAGPSHCFFPPKILRQFRGQIYVKHLSYCKTKNNSRSHLSCLPSKGVLIYSLSGRDEEGISMVGVRTVESKTLMSKFWCCCLTAWHWQIIYHP